MRRPPAALLRVTALAASTAAVAIGAAGGGTAVADTSCTRVASPSGSDSAPGTEAAPFGTAQKLVDSLGPGDVGCLRSGTYSENVTIGHGGAGDGTRVTVTSFPGERAKIDGRVYVTDNADYVTVQQLDLDGHNAPPCTPAPTCVLPSPTVNGDHVVFQDNDVTNRHRGICFNLGNYTYGRAQSDVIQRNRIHDCGNLPADNHEHGIYLSYSDDTQILGNQIYDNADRGIQLYPDAQRTEISGNVIDGNGEGVIFSGAGDAASNDNVLENNVITNSKLRHDVESWYPNVIGQRNVARNNCVFGGKQGEISKGAGFSASGNLVADPHYVDRGAKDFRLAADSPCAGVLAGAQLPVDLPATSPKPTSGGDSAGGVVIDRATLHRSHGHGHRWRLRMKGRLKGSVRGATKAIVEIRRGGRWQRLGRRRVRRHFRFSVDARIPRFHSARATRARVRIPGVGPSRSVVVRVRG